MFLSNGFAHFNKINVKNVSKLSFNQLNVNAFNIINSYLSKNIKKLNKIQENTKLIIGGDFMQSDINGKTGFKEFFDIFDDDESKEMGIHTFSFTSRDIVRSEILKFIIKKLDMK